MQQYENLQVNDTADSNAVQFWITNRYKFPKLFLCAREILGVPASSATSERAFSISGQISCKKRASLATKNIEELAIIRLNKLTIEKYKESHRFKSQQAMTETIEEVLEERIEDSGSESDEEEDKMEESEFEEEDFE